MVSLVKDCFSHFSHFNQFDVLSPNKNSKKEVKTDFHAGN